MRGNVGSFVQPSQSEPPRSVSVFSVHHFFPFEVNGCMLGLHGGLRAFPVETPLSALNVTAGCRRPLNWWGGPRRREQGRQGLPAPVSF